MEWFGLEGTLRIIHFQSRLPWAGNLPLGLAAQSPVQAALELSRDGTPTGSQFLGLARTALLSLACFQQMDMPIVEMGDQWIWRLRS